MLFIIRTLCFIFYGTGMIDHHVQSPFVCNRAADSLILIKLYQSTDGANWVTKWNLNMPINKWAGVVLDINGCVSELHLNSNNLNGNIPSEFGNLAGLKTVSLLANKLNGILPLNIGNLSNLEDFSIEDNQLSGNIPLQITNLSKLKYLNLAKNSFIGSIPSVIGNLSNLISLNLNSNSLSNSIPNSISLLSKLKVLDLSSNFLTGSVPASINQLSSINEIYLGNNSLSGELPASMSSMTTLVHIWINDNQFSGSVPDLRNSALNSLHIENNSFTSIPDYSSVTTWGNQYPFGLVIYGNKFTFKDLIPLAYILPKYYYSFDPQDPIELDSILFIPVGTTYIINTNVDPGFTESNFKWFKDTNVVYITNRNIYELINVTEADEGYYSAQIRNPLIPNFYLTISKFRVVVYDVNKCDIPGASINCHTAPEFCSSLSFQGYCSSLGNVDTTNKIFLCDSVEFMYNPKWISFIAPTDSIVLEIFPRNCQGVNVNGNTFTGMQAAIWNSCGGNSDSILVCQSICQNQPFKLGGKLFEIGNRYNIVLTGCHGDICDFIIKVVAGKKSFQLATPGLITGPQSFCKDSLDHFFSIDKIAGTVLYQWFINDTFFSNSVLPNINISGFNSGFYSLKVRATNSCDTTQVSSTAFQITPELFLKNILNTKIKLDSAFQISFNIQGGVKPYTVVKGRGTIDTLQNLFYSDTILCKSAYEFDIVDAKGCTIVYKGYENCNCNSLAGTMPLDTIKVCESQSLTVKFTGSETQDPGDGGVYILFTDSQNPKTSILKISGNGLFPFDPSKYKFDIYYYVSRVVGRKDVNGNLNFNHPCLSISNFQPVIFRSRPLVSVGPDLSFCGFEGTLNSFGNYLNGLWKVVSGPAQAFIENPPADETNVVVNGFGTYVFSREVSNGYCTNKDEVKVTFIESLKPVVGGFYFVCPGQSTSLDGGVYSKYLWSTGDSTRFIQINASGTYCLTVSDDANCTGTTCIAVSNSTAPVPHLIGPDTLCTGIQNFIQLTNGYLKYNWNTKDSSALLQIDTGGLYCVTVTANNGCIGTDCIQVIPKSRIYSMRYDTVCYGDNFTLLGHTFDQPGIHDILFNNAAPNGCDSVLRINLLWLPQIVLSNSNIIQDDGTKSGAISVVISGGKSPYKYQWSNGLKTSIITNLLAGDYSLIVTDANNCHAVFTFTVKRLTTSFQDTKKNFRFLIYPNPVQENGSCMIENRSDDTEIKLFIYNFNGIMMYKDEWKSKGFKDVLPVNLNLSAGIYFIKILGTNGRSDIQRIILLN